MRTQLPITLRPDSEPDIAVVRCEPGEYADRHPAAADGLLLIEVADTTLPKDRNQKALTYARAGIGDYWILDTNKRRAIIFRDPGSEGYASEVNLSASDALSPVAFADLVVPLSALFLS
ncbi:MAG: Uma2 family endonuclease [Aphanocapsa lilacina HA4352-LM1]|nr:Uma2 family endonuclease [Aphanocapsa lilacina HA4352-LM1]